MSIVEKPHLSPSQLEMFAKCPEQWRRRYVENEILPPGVAALKGKTVHAAAEANFRQKLVSGEDLGLEHFRELAAESFDAQVAGEYQLSAEEESRGKKRVLGEAKDAAVEMAEFHGAKQAPEYQPALVEQRFRVELPGPHDLLGVIDMADDRGRVIDFKTSGKAKSQSDADGSVQLTAYHVGHVVLTGRAPSELRLDVIVGAKKGLSRNVVKTARERADLAALAARLNVVSRAIEAGLFPPAAPGSWWCSAKWCGFYRTCRYVNSERAAVAEAAE